MNQLTWSLLTISLCSSCFGDLIISDVQKNEHFLVDDNLKLIRKFHFQPSQPLQNPMKVGQTADGVLVLYDLEPDKIAMYTVSNGGEVSKSGEIIVNKNDQISSFDVQPSGESVVISSGRKIYLFNRKDQKSTEILDTGNQNFITNIVVYMDPSARMIYFVKCSQHQQTFSLTFYNTLTAKRTERIIDSCYPHIDYDENLIWTRNERLISTFDIKRNDKENVASIKDVYSASDLSSEYLFFMRSEKKKNIYKLKSIPVERELKDLSKYRNEPVLSYLKDTTPVLFKIDEHLIQVLTENFGKIIQDIPYPINQKPIKSIKSISDDFTTSFFWIHDSNGGTVEHIRIDHNFDLIEKKIFKLPIAGKDIVDFDIDKSTHIFYFAIEEQIWKGHLKPKISVKPFDLKLGSPIKAVAFQKNGKLAISHCGSGSRLREYELDLTFAKEIFPTTLCIRKMASDEDGRLILMTANRLYGLTQENGIELIYSSKNIRNFLLDGDDVVLVSDIDGPAISAVNKRRIEKIDHQLPIDGEGSYVITHVKAAGHYDPNSKSENPIMQTSKPEKPNAQPSEPGNPNTEQDKPENPKANPGKPSKGSKVVASEQIFVVFLMIIYFINSIL